MDRVKIKEKARKMISNNLWNIWKPLLVIIVISFVLSLVLEFIFPPKPLSLFDGTMEYEFISFSESLSSIILMPLYVGYMVYLLNFIRGKKFEIKDLFSKMNYILPIWGVSILSSLFTGIGLIFLIVPGIIISLMLSMINYVMADGETNVMEVLRKSKKLTNGYIGDILLFGLSFLGWMLLSVITFGIALIYVLPYINVSMSLYYEELKKLKNSK